jgi:DNA-binding NarL/FixJ family response regulator
MTIRTILADDHRMLRDALMMLLSRETDIEVVGTAEDGITALALARNHVPDVLVLDIAMPHVNGMEVVRCLHDELPGIRILMLSAYMDKRFVREALKAGAHGYVTKAATTAELPRAIRALALGQNYLSSEVTSVLVSDLSPRAGGAAMASEVLTAREREVLRLVTEGVRTAAIARRLGVTEGTVDAHRRNLMRKLEIHTVAGFDQVRGA